LPNSLNEELDRQHIVRRCRELCAESGYSGTAFLDCVKECVDSYLRKSRGLY